MNARIDNIIQQFKSKKVLVLGDFMLDVYIDGQCSRLAPEASVPILDVQKQTACLGGAGNVVFNLRKLGARVNYVTILGQDDSAKTAIGLLQDQCLDGLFIHFTSLSPTLTKTRLRMDGQYIYRFDHGKKIVADPQITKAYLADVRRAYQESDAVLIADYNKGSISPAVLKLLIQLKSEDHKVFAVDCKDYERYKALEPTMIKPNYQEARNIVREDAEDDRVQQASRWSRQIWKRSNAQLVALSLDKDGVLLSQEGALLFHYPVEQIATKNVAGAGDTLLAALLLSHLSGASPYEAVGIACTAASIGIRKTETAHCTFPELQFGMLETNDKVLTDLEDVSCVSGTLRAQKRIVFTNGCFDIFHSGHAHYLRQARELGDVLIVGINTDESVRRIKGANRPVNTLADRIEVLKQMQCVDFIVPFGSQEDDTPVPLIEAVRPHIFVKGEDYKDHKLPESELLDKLGTEVRFMPYVPHQSTTKIIERVQQKDMVLLKRIS